MNSNSIPINSLYTPPPTYAPHMGTVYVFLYPLYAKLITFHSALPSISNVPHVE